MDLATLKTEHPDLYALVVKVGVDQERDRVVAHLTIGEASTDMKTAIGAIKDGSDMTMTLQAQYMTAGQNRQDVVDRDADTLAAEEATRLAAEATQVDTEAEQVAGAVEKSLGVVSIAEVS